MVVGSANREIPEPREKPNRSKQRKTKVGTAKKFRGTGGTTGAFWKFGDDVMHGDARINTEGAESGQFTEDLNG
jgi:hypothetical protein